ncbi:hypothetical protein N6O06_23100, partial [Escherichia coli]|nr:hypothetical protein [Escherichia coli]
SAQIREILISESTWEEMTCLFAPSLKLMFYRPPVELQEKFINIKNKIESIFYRKDKHEDLFASISNKLIHSIK